MKKYTFSLFCSVLFLTISCSAMQKTYGALVDVTPQLASPSLSSIGRLLSTCKTIYYSYQGLPEYLCKKPGIITQATLQPIQWGVDRFLQQNPDFCNQLEPHNYTTALVHYAQTNNVIMFKHMINHESVENKQIRLNILKALYHQDDTQSISLTDNMNAYLGKRNTSGSYNVLEKARSCLFRIFLLNDSCGYHGNKVVTFDTIALHGHTELLPLALSKTNTSEDLYDAVRSDNIEMCRKLIQEYGIDPNARCNGQSSICCAVKNGNLSLVTLLIEYGAKVNVPDRVSRDTPLHIAARNGNDELIQLLFENGADINSKNCQDHCPLHLAVQNSKIPLTTLLLLISEENLDMADFWNYTPLHRAAQANNIPATECLLAVGANINSRTDRHTDNENTPLHLAAIGDHFKIIELLLQHAQQYLTPEECSAYINTKNRGGKIALDVCNKHSIAHAYLQSASATSHNCIIS